MKRRITWAALAIAALVSGAPALAQQNELRVAYSTFAGELVDPIHGGLASQIYQMPVFDYLVTFDNNMRFTPGLAAGTGILRKFRLGDVYDVERTARGRGPITFPATHGGRIHGA